MKFLIVLAMISLPIAVSGAANELQYDLEVSGMKCAFCAYNVSKQIESLDGVVPQSVDVDLEQGAVRLRSEKTLDETRLADLLLQAGFVLQAASSAAVSTPQSPHTTDKAVFLSVVMNADELNEGVFDAVLEELGAIAVRRSGRIHVVAPIELEVTILKPVLAGRQSVIKVNYEEVNRPDQTVVVSVAASSTDASE